MLISSFVFGFSLSWLSCWRLVEHFKMNYVRPLLLLFTICSHVTIKWDLHFVDHYDLHLYPFLQVGTLTTLGKLSLMLDGDHFVLVSRSESSNIETSNSEYLWSEKKRRSPIDLYHAVILVMFPVFNMKANINSAWRQTIISSSLSLGTMSWNGVRWPHRDEGHRSFFYNVTVFANPGWTNGKPWMQIQNRSLLFVNIYRNIQTLCWYFCFLQKMLNLGKTSVNTIEWPTQHRSAFWRSQPKTVSFVGLWFCCSQTEQ